MANLFRQYAVRLKETKEVIFLLDTETGNYTLSDQLEVVKDDEPIDCYRESNGAIKVNE